MLGEKVLFSLKDDIFPDSESCKCDKSGIKKLGFHWLLRSSRLTFYISKIICTFYVCKTRQTLELEGPGTGVREAGETQQLLLRLHTLLCFSTVVFR